MKYHIVYDPLAIEEYLDSIEWYKEQSEITAKEFITEVRNSIEIISNNPFRYKQDRKKYRQYSLVGFPFAIIYKIDDDVLFISAIYHHKRNPKKKYRKK